MQKETMTDFDKVLAAQVKLSLDKEAALEKRLVASEKAANEKIAALEKKMDMLTAALLKVKRSTTCVAHISCVYDDTLCHVCVCVCACVRVCVCVRA